MATITTTRLIDDIDGTELPEGTKTTVFAFEGTSYRIDLSDDHQAELRKALKPFIDKARRNGAGASAARGTGSSSRTSKEKLAAIRSWAQENGIDLPARGRIKQEIVDRFEAEH
jgi:hypothetical protein